MLKGKVNEIQDSEGIGFETRFEFAKMQSKPILYFYFISNSTVFI